jgi:putative transcriptional regulator
MAIRILLSARLGERRWTQRDLHRATGIGVNAIGLIYNELGESIKLDHLDLICEALDCEVSDILRYEENKTPRVKSRTGNPINPRVKPDRKTKA